LRNCLAWKPNHARQFIVSESTITSEVISGSGLSLSQAARRFPPYRESRPVAPSTIFRWIVSGVIVRDGRRVRLEAVRLGGRWLTSVQAIERFVAAQTPALDSDPAPAPRMPTPVQRVTSAERAGQLLKTVHGI
jgi:hypothetical protein